MLTSFGLGALTQLSLVLSALAVFLIKVPRTMVGNFAGFGAGALIAAVATDLLPTAQVLEMRQVALWAVLGAGIFVLGEHFVEKRFGSGGSSGPLGIVVGAIVDGVPESVIFGVQIGKGMAVSMAFIAAVFVSNIPQALAPSADLAENGWSWRRVAALWMWVVLACGAAAALGYLVATSVSGANGARAAALASGGILAMLTNSLIPFAHERSPRAGIWTVVGFCSALAMG